MTNEHDAGRDPRSLANARLAEIEKLFADIRSIIEVMMDELGEPRTDTPAKIIKKMDELTKAHLTVLNAEDAFHAKFGYSDDADKIDYDAIRADIGRQLDRIRDSHRTEGVFVRSDG